MKKTLTLLVAAFGISLGLPLVTQADPATDLKEFQDYFKKKFPQVPFEDFSNGLYAIDPDRRAEWEAIMDFPPFELELEKGKQMWNKPFKNGKTFASCFKNGGVKIAQHYPYWDEATQQVRTLELDINECLKKNGEAEIKNLEKGEMAEVTAYLKSLSHGQKVSIDLSKPGAVAAYEQGKKIYWSRHGQLNIACANCHVDYPGKLLRGNRLGPGLGHGVGFPAYRSKWGSLGTLHRRYGGCMKQVRAAPYKPQSPELRALELYETYMNTGLPLTAPSQRF